MYRPPNIFDTTAMALLFYSLLSLSFAFLIAIIFSKTNLILILVRSWRSFTDFFHLYQLYKVPQFADENQLQENRLYRQVSAYLASLSSAEDSDLLDLVPGQTSGEVCFRIGVGETVRDEFLGARLTWTSLSVKDNGGVRAFVLRIRRNDRRRVFRQYLQRIQTIGDEIRLHVVSGARRWIPVPVSNPASFDTVIVEPEIKTRVISDLELFLKSRQYYQRIGRVWRRSYLLSGASGTGKTSFAAAMAKFLRYDVFDLEITGDHSDLKALILQTTPRSVIVVEDLGRLIPAGNSSPASLAAVVSFMDGIISRCGEERIVIFTINGKDKEKLDRTVMRPGLIDVNVYLPLCDNFSAFKNLASTYLGLKEHKLFPQVEEIFQTAGPGFLSPAHIGEIMLSNRGSPSRALKSVITALQSGSGRLSNSNSSRSVEEPNGSVFSRDGISTVKEFRKLYGLLKMGSRRKEESVLDSDSGSGRKEVLRQLS